MTSVFFVAELLLALLYLTVLFFVLVPFGLKAYERWAGTEKPRDLARVVMIVFFGIYLFAITAINLICLVAKFNNIVSYGVNREIIGATLLLFVYYFSIPKTIIFFRQWKLTKQHKPFSKMILSGILTIYSFAIVFAIFIPKFIPL